LEGLEKSAFFKFEVDYGGGGVVTLFTMRARKMSLVVVVSMGVPNLIQNRTRGFLYKSQANLIKTKL
jgi:hypothetical protein